MADLRTAIGFVWCVIDHYLSWFRWYRRWCGGHWERRWIGPPVASTMWLRNEHGNPIYFSMLDACEDYRGGRRSVDRGSDASKGSNSLADRGSAESASFGSTHRVTEEQGR